MPPSRGLFGSLRAEAVGAQVTLSPRRRVGRIRFYGDDILPGNWLFKRLILKPDTAAGIRACEAGIRRESRPLRIRIQQDRAAV